MSGIDKYNAVQALKAQGWIEAPEAGDCMLRPPRALLERLAAMTFHAYDARDLQEFSGTPTPDLPVTPPSKYDSFVSALNALCLVHSVQLCTSGYDGLQVWDLKDADEPLHANGVEDRTAQRHNA